MTQSDDQTEQSTDNGVKQSFAWGQLFAGTIIGGLAVWKLLHKMTNTEPSEWFAGLSLAYEEVRDFVMTPFQGMQLDLTASEKNLVALIVVLAGAILRAARRDHIAFAYLLAAAVFAAFYIGLIWVSSGAPQEEVIFGIAFAFAMASIWVPLSHIRDNSLNSQERQTAQFVLLNVAFTALWGIALLFLNWATS